MSVCCISVFFDKKTAKIVYQRQTRATKARGVPNCPLCAIGHDANAKRIYREAEMKADHVTYGGRLRETLEAPAVLCIGRKPLVYHPA